MWRGNAEEIYGSLGWEAAMGEGLTASDGLRVYDDILGTVGRTPLVRLNKVARGLACSLYAKLELFNPGGSVKDRIGHPILEAYEREGKLRPGGTVVEATSGNTGIGLAIACAVKGYQAVFVMPDKMSLEKVRLLRAFGAQRSEFRVKARPACSNLER